jgi:hypothetical protein
MKIDTYVQMGKGRGLVVSLPLLRVCREAFLLSVRI